MKTHKFKCSPKIGINLEVGIGNVCGGNLRSIVSKNKRYAIIAIRHTFYRMM